MEDLNRFAADVALALDDIAVAHDFVSNLLSPNGPDVVARGGQQSGGQERAGSGGGILFGRTLPSSRRPAIPQGDQLRRTRIAVQQAVETIASLTHTRAPADVAEQWALTVPTLDLSASIDALQGTVSAEDVTRAAGVLRNVAGELGAIEGRIRLAQIRRSSAPS